jgi:hypothetical protein
MQQSLFTVADYDELCSTNAEKVAALAGADTQVAATLGFIAVERRLEMVIAILKGLRLLPPEFEYLYEAEFGSALEGLL